mmetsp:Transcript_6226/g.8093  ORF Transcript_6226/g.8093 Transcript_6226/m.8093 type:complete len:158 (-) Transcript_6226:23-496(-)
MSADQLFAAAEAENAATTWILRFIGFLLMVAGISLVLQPIAVFADVLPLLGDIVGCMLITIAFIIAGFFSGLTISIAWLIYHPLIGGVLFLVFTVLTCGSLYLVRSLTQSDSGEGKANQKDVDEEAHQEQDSESVAKGVEVEAETVEEVPFGSSLGP